MVIDILEVIRPTQEMDAVVAVSDHICSGPEPQRRRSRNVLLESVGHCTNSDSTKAQDEAEVIHIV